MLGTLTMPNLISPASPARFWAWLRYAIAIAKTQDLRVTMDFADLDPHQKGILSDDFGVSISTQWLYQRFGGFNDIVDGRRFMLQFSHLLKRKQKVANAKVGPGKAPDFVIQDSLGRWHVLECKGTQSGRGSRNLFLKRALQQKNVIRITGGLRGERLASGLSISNEGDRPRTQLRVVDPEDKPDVEIELGEDQAREIQSAAHRIAVARALGVVGLNESAMEVWLPEEIVQADDFLRPSEISRLRESKRQRSERASQQAKERDLEQFQRDTRRYQGRSFMVRLPEFGIDSDIREIEVRVGVSRELLERVENPPDDVDKLGESAEHFASNARVNLESSDNRAVLKYGELLYAELKISE